MCQACCDLSRITPTAAPNCMDIPASGSVDYSTGRDALVIVTTLGLCYDGVSLTVSKVENDQGSTCRFRSQSSNSAFLPGPGRWRIFNSSARGSVRVVVLETYCGAAFAAYNKLGYGTATHSAPTLDATPASTLVVAANPNRSYLCIINDSAVVVYLAFGPAATANSGIRLNANGGSYEMSGQNVWRGVVNGIASSATAAVMLVTEGS